jgi:hypothetical protein
MKPIVVGSTVAPRACWRLTGAAEAALRKAPLHYRPAAACTRWCRRRGWPVHPSCTCRTTGRLPPNVSWPPPQTGPTSSRRDRDLGAAEPVDPGQLLVDLSESPSGRGRLRGLRLRRLAARLGQPVRGRACPITSRAGELPARCGAPSSRGDPARRRRALPAISAIEFAFAEASRRGSAGHSTPGRIHCPGWPSSRGDVPPDAAAWQQVRLLAEALAAGRAIPDVGCAPTPGRTVPAGS